MKMKYFSWAVAISLTIVASLSAQEPDTRVDELLLRIKTLENRIVDLEAKNLENPSTELEKQLNALTTGALGDNNEFTARWGNTRRFETADKAFQLKTGGRIMNDWVWGFQDNDYENAVISDASNPPLGRFTDGTEFRRARLFINGTIYSRVVFKLDFGFEGGDADFKDAYIGLKNIPWVGKILVGQFKIPFGLEYMTSSKYITFMERSMGSDAFIADRGTGLKFINTALEDDRLSWSVSVYREANTFGSTEVPSDGQYNFAARITALPWWENAGRRYLHVGFAANWRNPAQPGNGLSQVRYRSKPEVHLSPRVVDTGNFEAESALLLNAEVALVVDSFSLQGEFYYADVSSKAGNDPTFSAFNVYASYFLTGEHRIYKKSAGAFNRIKPLHNFLDGEGGIGAWEIAARFSMIDLNDGNINGGEAWNITLGLTWYLNPNTQVKLNYVYTNLDNQAGGSQEGAAHLIGMRFQIDF